MACKRVFFITNAVIPKKDSGGGSIVIYRHLARLKNEGFDVTIIIFSAGEDYHDDFQYIFIPKKNWYPFLRKKTPWLTDITIALYYRTLAKRINFNPATDITVGVLCEISNLVLVSIYKKKKVPYFMLFHDDNVFNRYWSQIALVKRHMDKILANVKHIFTVSAQMLKSLEERNVKNASVLYPIPEVYTGQLKQYNTTEEKALNFCYAGLAMHIHFDIMNRIGEAIGNAGGKFFCVTGGLTGFKPDAPEAIIIKDRFKTVAELQKFMVQDIDVVIVFYSFDLQHEPRMESSFPSKFLEYAQLGIPILLIAPDHSSLGKWAIENNWLSYVSSDDPEIITQAVEKLKNKEHWFACREQVICIAEHEFNPKNIHRQLTRYLNIKPSVNNDQSL